MTSLQKKRRCFQWIAECQQSFENLKHLLTTAHVLKVAGLEKSFLVSKDACKERVGGGLIQQGKVIAYESRQLKEYGQLYSGYDLELKVVVHALKMWWHCLLGKKFLLLKDHRNLTSFFNQISLNTHQARWTSFLREFDFEIKHLKGKEN